MYICKYLFQFLAVVYNAFVTVEKEKVRKLLIHRRRASSLAFKLLTDEQVKTAKQVRRPFDPFV